MRHGLSPSGHVAAFTNPDQPTVDIWDITDPANPRKRGTFTGLAPVVRHTVIPLVVVPLTDTVAIMYEQRDADSPSVTSLWDITRAPLTRVRNLDITTAINLTRPVAEDTLLLGSSDDHTRIFNIADPRNVKFTSIPNQTGVQQAAGFIDDHTVALAFQQNNQIRVWSDRKPNAPALQSTLTSQADIAYLTTDPAHQDLAAIGVDGSVRFWSLADIRNPAILNTIEPPQEVNDKIAVVVEFQNATNLAIISRDYPDTPDSEVVDLDPERVRKDLCARYPQRLTSAQWNRYATGIPIQTACP